MFKIYFRWKYYILKNLQLEENHPDTLTVWGQEVCQLNMLCLGGPCVRGVPCYGCPSCCLDSIVTGGMPCSGGSSLAPRTTPYQVWPSPPSSLARTPMRVAGGEDTSLFSLSFRGYGFHLRKLEDFPPLCPWVAQEDKVTCLLYCSWGLHNTLSTPSSVNKPWNVDSLLPGLV